MDVFNVAAPLTSISALWLFVRPSIVPREFLTMERLALMHAARPKVRVKVWPPLHLAEQLQLSFQFSPSGNRACTRLMFPGCGRNGSAWCPTSQFCVPYVITHPIVWQVCVMNGNLCFAADFLRWTHLGAFQISHFGRNSGVGQRNYHSFWVAMVSATLMLGTHIRFDLLCVWRCFMLS